jgi:hypothetical protein
MAFGSGDLNPHFFRWPSLPMYIMFFVYGSLYVIGTGFGFFTGTEDFLRLYVENPTIFWILGRSMSAFSALLTIILVFFIGRKLYDVRTGLLASLFLSVAYLHVRDSHYCTPDILLTLLMGAAFWFVIAVSEKGDLKSYLFAGLFGGLAASTKYVGGATICLTIFLVFLWNSLRSRKKETMRREFGYLLIAAATAALAFIAGTPFSVLDYQQFIHDVLVQAVMVEPSASKVGFLSSYFNGLNYIFSTILWNGLGIPLFVLYVSGMIASIFGRRRSDLLLWCYWLPYMVVFSILSIHRATYFTPIVPISCLFAASFLARVGFSSVRLIGGEQAKRCLAYTLTGAVLAYSGFQSFKFNYIITRPDTRSTAKEWVESHIPANSVILKEAYTPVLNKTESQLAAFIEEDTVNHESWNKANIAKNTIEYNIFREMHPQYEVYEIPSWKLVRLPQYEQFTSLEAFMRENRVQYVIVSSKSYLNFVGKNPKDFTDKVIRDRIMFYQWLEANGETLGVFRAEDTLPIIDNPEGYTFHNPVIKIYRI